MTVISRKKPVRRRRAVLRVRFPKGAKVRSYDDVEDSRYAGLEGEVVETLVDRTDPLYPQGRVKVRVVMDPAGFPGQRPPTEVWFKPNDLERL